MPEQTTTDPRPSPREIVLRIFLAAAALTVAWLIGPQVGAHWRPGIPLTLFVAAVVLWCGPPRREFAYGVAGLCGVAVLLQWGALRTAAYHLLLIVGTYHLRGRPRWLVAFLIVGVIVVPKELFRRFYHDTFAHDWVNPFLLAHLALVVLVWQSNERRGRNTETSFGAWLCLLLFPSHPFNPLTFSPGDVWGARTAAVRDVLRSLAILSAKALVMWSCARLWPHGQLSQQPAAALLAASWETLWGRVALSYVICALALSGTADVAIVVARVFGWNLRHSFRWALLAWNPVELWRRWAIYNRKVLLTLVYFPLGGGTRRRTLNVMITFAASGLVLHSGWLGSRYWEVGAAGWRDQTVYFLLQGLAVAACLLFWRWRGKDPASDRELRWSVGRVLCALATQALSAVLHIVVLAPQLSLADRLRLMGRCFGLGW